jgi:hypothetical protein
MIYYKCDCQLDVDQLLSRYIPGVHSSVWQTIAVVHVDHSNGGKNVDN